MTSADRIIDLFGGKEAMAQTAGVHPTRVYRWMQPKDAGGTGGKIPHKHWERLLVEAKSRGIPLKVEDFFSSEGAQ